jgi:EAL domain-containing protein (putative c-di-GMP-specific phosphodiesterase class I)
VREFEPIFDLRNKKVIGYEVLYRAVENRELFFEFCTEEQDLEIFLGSLEEIRRNKEGGYLYFVNLFGSTLLSYWSVIMENCSDLRDCLVLEISEKRRASSKEIRELVEKVGFLACLDDFGSGWSSVEAIIRIKPHFVKIDIKQVGEVFPLMVQVVRSLQLNPIVEKVETAEEFLQVRKSSISLIQGRFLEEIL